MITQTTNPIDQDNMTIPSNNHPEMYQVQGGSNIVHLHELQPQMNPQAHTHTHSTVTILIATPSLLNMKRVYPQGSQTNTTHRQERATCTNHLEHASHLIITPTLTSFCRTAAKYNSVVLVRATTSCPNI